MDTIRRLLRNRVAVAAALVTLLTFGVVSAVVLTTTSLGCSLKIKTARCLAVASLSSPSPYPSAKPGSIPPSPNPPTNPGESSNPPYNPGDSANPPYNPGASGGSPYTFPDSGSYPPLAAPASGSSGPGVALSCRLPVYANGPGSGGFIVFPGQTFVADPRSAVTAPSPSSGPTPTPPPYGGYVGWYGLTYDAAYSKWLPVPRPWLSPDGSRYAYPINGSVYVQSVAGGTSYELGQGRGFGVLELENEGVYVTTPNQPGLWFLALSGSTKQIATAGFWQALSHGYAYGTETSSVPAGASNTILRLDLASGTSVPFFSQQAAQSNVTGFDGQAHPLIEARYPNGVALFIVTGPNTATVIAANTYGYYNSPWPGAQPVADSHGLWFTVGNGIVLYTNRMWYWMSSIGGQLAGPCA